MPLTVGPGSTGYQGNVLTDTATGVTSAAPEEYRISGQAGLELNAKLRQPKTVNAILPTSYRFVVARSPNIAFFCQSLSIPAISIGTAIQESPFSDIHLPSGNQAYEDLTLNFIVDEKMANWIEIFDWMQSIAIGDQMSVRDKEKKTGIVAPKDRFSDVSVVITTNQSNAQIVIDFKNAFPTSLGELEFTSIDNAIDPITSTVTFTYDSYTVTTLSGY